MVLGHPRSYIPESHPASHCKFVGEKKSTMKPPRRGQRGHGTTGTLATPATPATARKRKKVKTIHRVQVRQTEERSETALLLVSATSSCEQAGSRDDNIDKRRDNGTFVRG